MKRIHMKKSNKYVIFDRNSKKNLQKLSFRVWYSGGEV